MGPGWLWQGLGGGAWRALLLQNYSVFVLSMHLAHWLMDYGLVAQILGEDGHLEGDMGAREGSIWAPGGPGKAPAEGLGGHFSCRITMFSCFAYILRLGSWV